MRSQYFWISIAVFAVIGGLVLLLAVGQFDGPTAGEEREASWEEAVAYIEKCEAALVFQSHALDVEIELKNGERVHAKEPAIDEVFRLLEQTRDTCGTIPMATE
jgi:hypothetical protein